MAGTLRPVAQPGNDSYTPNTGAGRDLAALAEGLSQFSQHVTQFTRGYAEVDGANQKAEGEKAARTLTEANVSYNDAVKKGVLPRSQNPFYVAGVKEQFGRVAADNWHSALEEAIGKDGEMQNTTDLSAFDAFVQKHRQDWLAQNVGADNRDKFFEVGFGHRSDAYTNDARDRFANVIGERLKTKSDEAHFAEVSNHIVQNLDKDPSVVAADINQLNTDLIGHGRDGRFINNTTVRAVTQTAIDLANQGDLRALKVIGLLDKLNGGSGPLRNTVTGKEEGNKALPEINNALWLAHQRESERAKQEKDTRWKGVIASAVGDLVNDPNANLMKYVPQLADNPSAIQDLKSMQATVNDLTFRTDMRVKQSMMARVWEDMGTANALQPTDILRAPGLTFADRADLLGQIDRRDAFLKTNTASDPYFAEALSGIEANFRNPTTGVLDSDKAEQARQAKSMFSEWWVNYNMGGGDKKDPRERIAWLNTNASQAIEAARGPGAISINPAGAPQFRSKQAHLPIAERLPPKAVITRDDLVRMQSELQTGHYSTRTRSLIMQYQLTEPNDIAAFMRSQLDLVVPPKSTQPKP